MAKPSKKKTKQSQMPASICWFDVPADDLGRAKKFYSSLFAWRFAKLSTAVADYWHIDTGGKDASPDGGLLPRMHPGHSITVYVSVPNVDKAMEKVEKLGGAICKSKTAVPHLGYFVICEDTEHNTFALWEPNERAKQGLGILLDVGSQTTLFMTVRDETAETAYLVKRGPSLGFRENGEKSEKCETGEHCFSANLACLATPARLACHVWNRTTSDANNRSGYRRLRQERS